MSLEDAKPYIDKIGREGCSSVNEELALYRRTTDEQALKKQNAIYMRRSYLYILFFSLLL